MLCAVYYAVSNAASWYNTSYNFYGLCIVFYSCIFVNYIIIYFTVITEGPVSVSVLIGTNAQFHCAGTGVVITWEVDGLASTNPVISGRGITSNDISSSSGTVRSNLTVPATSVNNGTTVRCGLFSSSGAIFSNNSILTVLSGNIMCYNNLAIPIVM